MALLSQKVDEKWSFKESQGLNLDSGPTKTILLRLF